MKGVIVPFLLLISSSCAFVGWDYYDGVNEETMVASFLGEIRPYCGPAVPKGWMECDGRLLAIREHLKLFSVLGTTYGGDGRTTFALPDMRGRMTSGAGSGPGLSRRTLGERYGREQVTLEVRQLPTHQHAVHLDVASAGGHAVPRDGHVLASHSQMFHEENGDDKLLHVTASDEGGSQAHSNMQPSVVLTMIISVDGVVPDPPLAW